MLMNDDSRTRLDGLVNRFLAWKLPDSVCSDQCATQRGYPHRTGTTLLTADEARQMLEHVLQGTTPPSATLTPDAKDAAQYLFLRTNYPRMIISICCGTFQGQTIEEAESRLDKSIGSDAAMAPTDDTTKGSAQ